MPREKSHGDLATNAAMQLTKIAKRNPRQIAEEIIANLNLADAGIEKAEIAGPGFINFKLDKSYLYPVLNLVHEQGENYGRIDVGAGKKVEMEFVSANPTGSLHLGHARGAAVGDALCNILDYAGYEVTREYYINDAGNQVFNLARSIEARYLQELGQDAEMPEDGYHGEDIKGFAKELVAEKGDSLLSMHPGDRAAYFRDYGLEKELDKIKRDLNRFRVNFDIWFSETSLYDNGEVLRVLDELRERNEIYEKDGATWLKTMQYGDDKERVLIKNDGTYTYLTPDIAYHRDKYARGYDTMINIWGADHHGYIPRMKAAMQALGNDPDKLVVLFYVQYAHARVCSVYRQAEEQGIELLPLAQIDLSKLTTEHEYDLLRKMGELPEEIAAAATGYAPHRIIRYVYELASLFHSYYRAERVITEDAQQTQARLALIGAVRTVIATALRLVGVSAPDKM